MPEFFTTISQRKEFDKLMKQKIDKLVNLSDLATNRDREAAIKIQRRWRRTKTPEHKMKLAKLVEKLTANYIQMNKVQNLSNQLKNMKLYNRDKNGNVIMNINLKKK